MRPARKSWHSVRMVVAGLFILAVVAGWPQGLAVEPLPNEAQVKAFNIDQLQTRIFSTIEKVVPAVVSIGAGGGGFSGVIVSPEGYVLSAGHAVKPGQKYWVKLDDGRRLEATGLGSSKCLDCGLIKIVDGKKLPFVGMADSTKLVANQPCLSISFPGGSAKFSKPVVRFGRIVRPGTEERMIQSTALMEPGDSGGPLFDLNGRVIAIHSRIGREMSSNFDVAVEVFNKHWGQLTQAKTFCGHPRHDRHEPAKDNKDAGEQGTMPGVAEDGQDEQAVSAPEPIPELAQLPQQFAALEDRLDDHCVVVTSLIGKEQTRILATLIANSRDLISKSSMVGMHPTITLDDRPCKLEVVARDPQNDLVLLQTPEVHSAGVALAEEEPENFALGTLLMSPNPDGPGWMSVRSSVEFVSKQTGKGFLGVVPDDNQGAGAVLDVRTGAARKAGLKTGDVILKMDDTDISDAAGLRKFLSKTRPHQEVSALVLRKGERLEKKIALDAGPTGSDHIGDRMDKSERREGFSRVFAHDADLHPTQCGGPLYDLKGRLMGLNIARHSRVRSFAILCAELAAFVKQCRAQGGAQEVH